MIFQTQKSNTKAKSQKPEAKKRYQKNIYDLTQDFSLSFHTFLKTLTPHFSSIHILKQVYRSSSSVTANMLEAQCSLRIKELAYKYSLALKEARETKYWLELLMIEYPEYTEQLNLFLKKLVEIIAILTVCIKKLRMKND